MVDIRSLISQIPMEPGYVPAPPEPDLSVIQRLMGLPQTLRAVGQNMAVGAASLPVGVYKGLVTLLRVKRLCLSSNRSTGTRLQTLRLRGSYRA
jgi:hypothetical protein